MSGSLQGGSEPELSLKVRRGSFGQAEKTQGKSSMSDDWSKGQGTPAQYKIGFGINGRKEAGVARTELVRGRLVGNVTSKGARDQIKGPQSHCEDFRFTACVVGTTGGF